MCFSFEPTVSQSSFLSLAPQPTIGELPILPVTGIRQQLPLQTQTHQTWPWYGYALGLPVVLVMIVLVLRRFCFSRRKPKSVVQDADVSDMDDVEKKIAEAKKSYGAAECAVRYQGLLWQSNKITEISTFPTKYPTPKVIGPRFKSTYDG